VVWFVQVYKLADDSHKLKALSCPITFVGRRKKEGGKGDGRELGQQGVQSLRRGRQTRGQKPGLDGPAAAGASGAGLQQRRGRGPAQGRLAHLLQAGGRHQLRALPADGPAL
jgi:hypothetical protein